MVHPVLHQLIPKRGAEVFPTAIYGLQRFLDLVIFTVFLQVTIRSGIDVPKGIPLLFIGRKHQYLRICTDIPDHLDDMKVITTRDIDIQHNRTEEHTSELQSLM